MSTPFTSYAIQRALKVTVDGKFGPETEGAMREALGNPRDNTNRPWSKKRLIIGYQQKLMKEAGIAVEVDGLIGPATLHAFEQYQDLLRKPEGEQAKLASASWWDGVLATIRRWFWPSEPERKVEEPRYIPVPETGAKTELPPLQHSVWPRQKDVPSFYGAMGENQVRVKVPWPMVLAWDTSKPVSYISLHRKVAPSAERALAAILAHYGPEGVKALGLHLYGGSLNVRKVRGGDSWSMHSWGIAIDWDPDHNQLRWNHTKARLAKPDAKAFWDIWEAEGWVSLGRERDFDWMHVQAARL